MKKRWYLWQIFFIFLIILFYFLKQKTLFIIAILFELLVLYGTFRKKEKNQYCLPASLARSMKKVSLETQYESSILGTFLILIGLVVSGIYSLFFLNITIWAKFLIIFNVISGIILLSSQLITTYQQYNSYKETKEIMGNINKNALIKSQEGENGRV